MGDKDRRRPVPKREYGEELGRERDEEEREERKKSLQQHHSVKTKKDQSMKEQKLNHSLQKHNEKAGRLDYYVNRRRKEQRKRFLSK